MARFLKILIFRSTIGFTFWAQCAEQKPVVDTKQEATASSESYRCKRSDLRNHPFIIGGLILTINSYTDSKLNGREWFDLRVENPGNGFLSLHGPSNLFVVNSEGRQEQLSSDHSFLIAPGAFVSLTYQYWNNNKLKLPAKIYFGDKLLAEITE
jgi:hypothetical protein